MMPELEQPLVVQDPPPKRSLIPTLVVFVGLTPLLSMLLTWLVLLPFVAARAGLDLVGADHGLSMRASPVAIMFVVLVTGVARAVWVHAREGKIEVGRSWTTWVWWLVGLVLCTGMILAGAASVWIEVGGAGDLSPSLQRALVVGGFFAWSVPVTVLTIMIGAWLARVGARMLQWDGFVRALGLAVLIVPSGVVAVILVDPRALDARDEAAAMVQIAGGTNALLELSASPHTLVDGAGLGSGDGHGVGGAGGSHGVGDGARYDVVECFEALSTPPLPEGSSLRDEARCGWASSRLSPIEDVWCALRGDPSYWDLEDAMANAIVAVCEQRPHRSGRLAGYLRTATVNEMRQERRRARSRERNAPPYYDRLPPPADPDALIDGDRCLAALAKAVDALPRDDRTLLLDKYQHRKSWAQIAAERGQTATAVRKRGERIRKSLVGTLGPVCRP